MFFQFAILVYQRVSLCKTADLSPRSEVIVLDEIEKAHRSFARALLTVFGEYGS